MKKRKVLRSVCAAIILIFLILFFIGLFTDTQCNTIECFVTAANNCGSATLTRTDEAGTVAFAVNKCAFTKTVVKLDENETQEMKDLLQGKSLTCRYEQGKFDQRWITSLTEGIENCEGELKQIIGRLLAFV